MLDIKWTLLNKQNKKRDDSYIHEVYNLEGKNEIKWTYWGRNIDRITDIQKHVY